MIGRTLKRKWHFFPSAEKRNKKISLESDIVMTRWGEARAKTPGKEDGNILDKKEKETLLSSQTPKIK